MSWQLHERLKADTLEVCTLALSTVLLMNNQLFPWLILVPRVEGAREIIDLSAIDRHRLMDEISLASEVLSIQCKPDKVNVAALGNMVPQLHVHVIARFTTDTAWPNPVWGSRHEPYADPSPFIRTLAQAFTASR